MSFNNAIWKAEFTGIASNRKQPSLSYCWTQSVVIHFTTISISDEHWRVIHLKTQLGAIQLALLVSPLQPSIICREGILHEGILALSSLCSRRRWIDEADINAFVIREERAAISWGKLTFEQLNRTNIHRHVKEVPIVLCWRHFPSSTASFSSCSVFLGPLLPNSHHCGTVPHRAIGKTSFSKAYNSL